ncbi:MAG: sulfatase-like hydrolase/transferase [Kiritimatiellales bacterium]
MKNGNFIKNVSCGIFLFGLSQAQADTPPNFLVILADDLGWGDVGFNGCRDIPTPNLDRLASSGAVCTTAYATHPYCGPSRAGLLTGRMQQRFGNVINPPFAPADSKIGLSPNEKTFAGYLQDAGYYTGIIGKWHLGAAEECQPLDRGFDYFFGFLGGGRDYFPDLYPPEDAVWNNLQDVWYYYKLPLSRGRHKVPDARGYLTDLFTDDAVGFIRKNKNNPFFLYLAYNAPHTPLTAKKEDLARFAGIADEKRRTYAAMVSSMDQGIGRVLEALDQYDLRKNTLVIFASDNGGKLPQSDNGPLNGEKGSCLEGGFRVPLAVSWPGHIPAGQKFDGIVSLLDVAATATSLAGAVPDTERPLDGVNLIPWLTGQKSGNPHDTVFAERYFNTDPDVGTWACRSGDFKLVQYKLDGTPCLYNLADDIGETHNIRAAFPEKAQKLQAEYDAWRKLHVPPAWGWKEEGGYDVRYTSMQESRKAFDN